MPNDLISDMLTRIRNASLVKQNFTIANFSKISVAILKILKKEAYISNYKIININNKKKIKILLKYNGWWIQKPTFSILKRISKPGLRIFSSYKKFSHQISTLKYKQGVAIISTSMGVMSHSKAIQLKKGGEILCYIE